MVDDILSLVILAVLSQVSDEDDTMSAGDKAWLILRPIIVSVCVIIGGLLCVRITPTCIKYLTRKFSDDHYDVIVLGVLLVSTAALTLGSGYAGSTHLLGSFAAGMSFSRVPHALELYIEHFQSMSELLTSIFFASIGFVIPVSELFDPVSFGYGLLYTVPAVSTRKADNMKEKGKSQPHTEYIHTGC
eukprot:m.166269 g.166269  ORF g.166269 m.166269 type:complete len:188 (+) comp25006_c0_seq7:114-677(+)